MNPCSFAFYPLLKQSIVTIESSFNLLLGQSCTSHEETSTEEAPNGFNVNLGEDNDKKTNDKMQDAPSGGRQTRTRLNTADRQKLESLNELSGFFCPDLLVKIRNAAPTTRMVIKAQNAKWVYHLRSKEKKCRCLSVTNVLDDRQAAAKRRFLNKCK